MVLRISGPQSLGPIAGRGCHGGQRAAVSNELTAGGGDDAMARQNCESKPQSLTPTLGRAKKLGLRALAQQTAPAVLVTRLGGVDLSWPVLDVASQLGPAGLACRVLLCAPPWHQLPGVCSPLSNLMNFKARRSVCDDV